MTSDRDHDSGSAARKSGSNDGAANRRPGWANGLRQLYDSVVDEDLPDSFKDLLSKLDEKD